MPKHYLLYGSERYALAILRPALEAFYNSLSDEQRARFDAIGPDLGRAEARAARNKAADANACGGDKAGLAAVPIETLRERLNPNDQQKALLDKLDDSTNAAIDALATACPDAIPLTPTGRLASMTRRVEATLRAVRTVRPALDAFYNSLSDEQKARFTNMGPEEIGADERKRATREPSQAAQACGDPRAGLVDLPMQEIEQAVQPQQGEQREKFDKLSLAATSAVELLQSACPDAIALTPWIQRRRVARAKAESERFLAPG